MLDQSVGPLVMSMYFGRMADAIEMLFGIVGWVGPRKHVLDGK